MSNLGKFKGVLPYATELRGVYQPLLGWEAKGALRRLARETVRLADDVVNDLASDPRLYRRMDGGTLPLDVPRPPVVGSMSNRLMAVAAASVREAAGPVETLTPSQWRELFSSQTLQEMVCQVLDTLPSPTEPVDMASLMSAPAMTIVRDDMERQVMATASILNHLAQEAPNALEALFLTEEPNWRRTLSTVSQLQAFSTRLREEVLSPVGLIHIYRQYFFEFESFLGPAVGHVWLSPGGTVELVEVNVRRAIVERTAELALEQVSRVETSSTIQDELSDAVKQQNAENIKFGASVRGGFNVLVAHGEASASFDLDSARQSSSEITHRETRQQSEKLSSEIRRNYKTTFRTVTEVTDTSSRRYVLQNTTQALINYELRRKMRQVGVQLQHIGTQLCWQYYIDDPGRFLWTSTLVHVAKPDDAEPAKPEPDAPVPLAAQTVRYTAPYTLLITDNPEQNRDAPGVTYTKGYYSGPRPGSDYIRMQHIQRFTSAPPPGMRLSRVDLVPAPLARVDPNRDAPHPFVPVPPRVTDPLKGEFEIEVTLVNFQWQPEIPIPVDLVYDEDPAYHAKLVAEYERRMHEYRADQDRAAHEAYVRAVRERIKVASEVKPRRYEDLREEERHTVFRRLIDNVAVDAAAYDAHVLSELIRRLFDLDAMMYFVAPDWWRPQRVSTSEPAGQAAGPRTLTEDDKVGWGGMKEHRRPNYMITEESAPAPLGASLGWLLQLDGDNLRNAFLNSAWVKVVIPIRLGREREALDWLRHHSVEGNRGLAATYAWQPGDPEEYKGKTIEEVIYLLADEVAGQHDVSKTPDPTLGALPTEVVFEHGFEPLEGSVRVDAEPFEVFDQWLEMVPTDQIVALEYKPR